MSSGFVKIKALRKRWMTFGLSAEQEDRFRQANLATDIAQARITISLILAPLVAFAVNDYGFFGLSWQFYGLTALRLALVAYTVLLIRSMRGLASYRSYDRAEFTWGLVFAVFVIAVAATRPQAFVAHTVVAVLAVFLTVLAVPNRFRNQLIVSVVYTVGETLVIAPSLWTAPQASVTALLSMFMANSIAIASAWRLHSWRRREFRAREEEQKAKAEAERQLAERQRAEEALRQQREWLRVTLTSIGDAVIAGDTQGRVTFLNPVAAALTGWTPEEALGQPMQRVFRTIDELTGQPAEDLVDRVLREQRVIALANHTALVTRDGRQIPIEDSAAPILDAAGHLAGLVLVFRDVTEKRREQQERETAVEFLRMVNDSKGTDDLIQAATGFFQQRSGCEAVGIRLRAGHDYPYYETRGFPKEFVLSESRLCSRDKEGQQILDSIGNPVLECMCGNVIRRRFDPSKPFFSAKGSFWTNSTTELLATSTEADRQARTRNRCHGEGYESVALFALRVGEERLGLLQLNNRRRGCFTPEIVALWERLADYLAVALSKFAAEEALRQSEVQVRRALEAEQEARALAESAVRVRDEFISIAAHELKTPVTSLQGFSQLLLRQAEKTGGQLDTERALKSAQRINEQSKRLTRLTEQLLDLSRLETGKLVLTQEETDLTALVRSLVASLQISHIERPIEVRDGEEIRICADALRIEQVLSNLIDNALKFSPRESPVEVEVSKDGHGWVRIAIRDHGIGIPEEKRERVFERFYQAHAEQHYGGMGIGLFVSHQVVEMHGGTISVEQPEGQGTRFVVRLPVSGRDDPSSHEASCE